MYKPGDHVFYPKGGVFVIQEESNKTIGGRDILFLDLLSCDGKTKISIPKTNIERVGVRALVTDKELEDNLAEWVPDFKISKLHHKNRKSRFETLRQTGDFGEMGKVVVTIHHLISKTKATFEEKRMYDQIRKRIVDEVEIVRSLSNPEADKMLQAALDVAITRKPPKEEELDEEIGAEGTTESKDSTETVTT